MSAYLIAITSDTHAGGTTALCHPDPIPLDDGGQYVPSKGQRWLYGIWERFWNTVEEVRDREGAKLIWLQNGDTVEGVHHRSAQVPSNLTVTHGDIFKRCAQLPLSLGPDHIIAVRGTEAHNGISNQVEEGLFRGIREEHPVVSEPSTGNATWWQFRGEFDGVLIDATHHGKMSQMPHLREGFLRHYASRIWQEHALDGHRAPDLAIRSHYHQFGDTGPIVRVPVRVIATPAFQLPTAYVYRKFADSASDAGGVMVLIKDGEVAMVKRITQRPDRDPAWKASPKAI